VTSVEVLLKLPCEYPDVAPVVELGDCHAITLGEMDALTAIISDTVSQRQ
jgi:hypothetical protein